MLKARLSFLSIPAMLLGLVVAAGCNPTQPPAVPPTTSQPTYQPTTSVPSDPAVTPTTPTDVQLVADGGTCLQASECSSGTCEGQGCDAASPGTCVAAARACTRDLRQYCGCDGITFNSSGSCAGARYSAVGACPTSP